jgi:hypothetical protein
MKAAHLPVQAEDAKRLRDAERVDGLARDTEAAGLDERLAAGR